MYTLLLLFIFLITANTCEPNCIDCSKSYCTACASGYELTIDSQCVPSTITGCALYDLSGGCHECQPTYKLVNQTCSKQYSGCIQRDQNGSCILCTLGTALVNSTCIGVINCETTSNNCTKCLQGFKQKDGICLDETHGCMIFDMSSGVCAMMNQGYELLGYNSVNISLVGPNCYVSTAEGLCQICKTGYILNSKKKCVIPGNKICREFDQNNICLSCSIPRLTLLNGSCVDLNCKVGAPGNCITCQDGYVINTEKMCKLIDPFCLDSVNISDRCDNCKVGYFVNINGTCNKLPINCKAADIALLTCIECISGFNLVGNTCKPPFEIANCLKVNQQTFQCSLCKPNYFISRNSCLKVSFLCDGFDPKSGLCINCKAGYFNFGGKCVDPYCQSSQGDSCLQCKPNFKQSTLTGLCQFFDSNCISISRTGCNACANGYYLNPITCEAYPPFCIKLSNENICIQCKPGFSLTNGKCVIPIPNCLKYGYNNSQPICISCIVNYSLQNSTCVYSPKSWSKDENCLLYNMSICVQCSKRYYISNNICIAVNPNCKDYSNDGSCTDCYPGYITFNGTCIPNSNPKDPFCRSYTNNVCTVCYNGYFYNSTSKSCQLNNPLCKAINLTSGACIQCYSGYSLKGDICVTSKDPNCINFDLNGTCKTCSSRFYMRNSFCTPINPLCKTFNISTGNCLSCYPGYYLSNGGCFIGADPNTDINCKLKDNLNRCLQCYSNYFLATNLTCVLANPLCKTLNITSGACLTCYPGYTLVDSDCVISNSNNSDPNCISRQNSDCKECYIGYFLSKGVCTKINSLCKTYNKTNGACLSCYPGYQINQNQCSVPQTYKLSIQDPYCTRRSGLMCTTCSNGYYPVNGACQALNPLCRTYDPASGACKTCYNGYSLQGVTCEIAQEVNIPFCQRISNGFCKKCIQGYYTQTPSTCSPVSILCRTYDQNTGNCLTCIPGYFLQVGQCIYPSMGFDGNCINYDTSAYCIACKPGFYLLNYICTKIDPFCLSFDSASLVCSSCGGGKTASGANCK